MTGVEKARLRDEAELAALAWAGQGRVVTVCPASRAPVCVPGEPRRVVYEGGRLVYAKAAPDGSLNALFSP